MPKGIFFDSFFLFFLFFSFWLFFSFCFSNCPEGIVKSNYFSNPFRFFSCFFSIWLFVLLLPLELSRRIAKRSFLSNPFSFSFHCIFRVVSFSFCPWICPGELPRTFFSRTLFVFSFVFSFVFFVLAIPQDNSKGKTKENNQDGSKNKKQNHSKK